MSILQKDETVFRLKGNERDSSTFSGGSGSPVHLSGECGRDTARWNLPEWSRAKGPTTESRPPGGRRTPNDGSSSDGQCSRLSGFPSLLSRLVQFPSRSSFRKQMSPFLGRGTSLRNFSSPRNVDVGFGEPSGDSAFRCPSFGDPYGSVFYFHPGVPWRVRVSLFCRDLVERFCGETTSAVPKDFIIYRR